MKTTRVKMPRTKGATTTRRGKVGATPRSAGGKTATASPSIAALLKKLM